MADAGGATGGDPPVDAAWSVTELNDEIESVLADAGDRFPTYVVGEVSDVNAYDFGTFFDLRDLDGEATISCLVWSYQRDASAHDLAEGVETVLRASVGFYVDDGRTQLTVQEFWPVGESDRSQNLAELRAALEAEGLFSDDRKEPLPAYPTTVGVVTSPSGSAREDVREAIHGRDPRITIAVAGATVQGDEAVQSIVSGVGRLDRNPNVDCIVVTRGGGADVDLWAFNEEPVIRAIADCLTPTVVAVGHEDDETLAELVADRRAMTPTDAGVVVAPRIDRVRQRVRALERRIETAYGDLVTTRLAEIDRRIDAAATAIEQATVTRAAVRQRASDLGRRIGTAYDGLVDARLDRLERRIDDAVGAVERDAEQDAITARAARGRVRGLERRIDRAYRSRVTRELETLDRRIDEAYREMEVDATIAAETTAARRLRVAVAVLLVVVGALLLLLLVGVL